MTDGEGLAALAGGTLLPPPILASVKPLTLEGAKVVRL